MSKVLVIEDNEDNRIVCRTLLEEGGHEVVEAETGEQGYAMSLKEAPDFIILDIQLPDIDGTEVLRRLRDNEATKNIPVIAVTSYAMAGDQRRLLSAGCNGYIEKPVEPEGFLRQVEEILVNI